jgi:type II secretory pathway component PulJ
MTGTRIISKEDGFTLVELFIYMVMFIIVMGALYSVFIGNTKSYSSQENKVEMVQDLRAAMHLVVSDTRMAGLDPTGAGGIGFIDHADDKYDTDGNSIHFTMDFDGNGAIDHSEDINYYLRNSGGVQQIVRRTGDGNEPVVAENITSFSLTYLFEDGDTGTPDESDGDTTNDFEDIRSIEIAMTGETAEVDPVTRQKKTRSHTSWAVIRNAGIE